MMVVGRRRKRYLLLTCSGPTDAEMRKEFTRLVLERHPALDKKVIWLDHGLIVRTDSEHLVEAKWGSPFKVGEIELVTRRASGSISKLKRMASGGEEWHGQVLR